MHTAPVPRPRTKGFTRGCILNSLRAVNENALKLAPGIFPKVTDFVACRPNGQDVGSRYKVRLYAACMRAGAVVEREATRIQP